eukprot:c39928_g1_i1.p1 GENE.c39928_g1_i1~~c39928_g1_i1.p1  ORF type:complete len:338 (+),score=65.04 c39928_g1_i1:60-1073(+)
MRLVLVVIAVALAFGGGVQFAVLWTSTVGLSSNGPLVRATLRNVEVRGSDSDERAGDGDPIGEAVMGAIATAAAAIDLPPKRVPLPIHRPATSEAAASAAEYIKRAAEYRFIGFHAKDVEAVYRLLFNASTHHGPAFWVYEVGALDGVIDGSISHFFERALGWSTLLQEANAANFKGLKQNRPQATLVEGAICGADNEAGTLEFLGDYGGSVGAVKTMDPMHRKTFHGTRDDTYVVRCEPLALTLARVGIPHIDLWSLDVEGAELVALDSMDWNIPVRALLIEINKLDLPRDRVIEAKLTAVGFRMHGWISSLNQLWINDGFDALMAARNAYAAGKQ